MKNNLLIFAGIICLTFFFVSQMLMLKLIVEKECTQTIKHQRDSLLIELEHYKQAHRINRQKYWRNLKLLKIQGADSLEIYK